MKPRQPTVPGGDSTFTVILPGLLRERFERWLRREHIQMRPIPGGDQETFLVIPPAR